MCVPNGFDIPHISSIVLPCTTDELSPLHPFLPKHAKDATKPTCFLERIDVTLVWRTESAAVAKKRKRNPRKGVCATDEGKDVANSSSQQIAQAGEIGEFAHMRRPPIANWWDGKLIVRQ